MFDLAALKAYLGTGVISAVDEGVLEDVEERAVALVQTATGRVFDGAATETRILDGGAGVAMYLGPDAATVTNVYVRETVATDWTELDSDAFEFTAYKSRLTRVDGGEWPDGVALVKVTGSFGFAAGAAPAEIQQLVLDLVNWQFRTGRKLSADDQGAPNVAKVPGWDRVINLYRKPLYG